MFHACGCLQNVKKSLQLRMLWIAVAMNQGTNELIYYKWVSFHIFSEYSCFFGGLTSLDKSQRGMLITATSPCGAFVTLQFQSHISFVGEITIFVTGYRTSTKKRGWRACLRASTLSYQKQQRLSLLKLCLSYRARWDESVLQVKISENSNQDKDVNIFLLNFRPSIRSQGRRRPAAVCTLWCQKLWKLNMPSRPHKSRVRYSARTHQLRSVYILQSLDTWPADRHSSWSVVSVGKVQRGLAEGAVVQFVLQPSSNPADRAG